MDDFKIILAQRSFGRERYLVECRGQPVQFTYVPNRYDIYIDATHIIYTTHEEQYQYNIKCREFAIQLVSDPKIKIHLTM